MCSFYCMKFIPPQLSQNKHTQDKTLQIIYLDKKETPKVQVEHF